MPIEYSKNETDTNVVFNIEVPNYSPIFDKIREEHRHLTMKDVETNDYYVSIDEIEMFADKLLDSEFYTEPWLEGCNPPTVLLPWIINDLEHPDDKRMRKAVNAAFNAETRIINMGLDKYIEWCYENRTGKTTPLAKRPKSKAVEQLKSIKKSGLTETMPEDLRYMFGEAIKALSVHELNDAWAKSTLMAVRQQEDLAKISEGLNYVEDAIADIEDRINRLKLATRKYVNDFEL